MSRSRDASLRKEGHIKTLLEKKYAHPFADEMVEIGDNNANRVWNKFACEGLEMLIGDFVKVSLVEDLEKG